MFRFKEVTLGYLALKLHRYAAQFLCYIVSRSFSVVIFKSCLD